MLTQFRKRYPQGSLISELIEIDRGKYIVRALVQVEGVTLATGLASCDTVEQAEDRARDRALTLLNLNEEVVTHQELIETKSQVTQEPEPIIFQASKESDRSPSKDRKKSSEFTPSQEKVESGESLPLLSNGATSSKTTKTKTSILPTPEPQLEIQKVTPEIAEPKKTQLDIQEVTSEITEVAEPEKPQLDIQEAAIEMAEPEEKDGNSGLSVSKTTQPVKDNLANEETESFDELIEQTDIELKRLGWTKEKGRDYLLQAYGKRSRLMLTDEELREFLEYLKIQPLS